MNTRRITVLSELLLLSPAVLFLGAVFVRTLGPLAEEPARSAQRIVMAYAERHWTLWVLLITLPLIALVTGGTALLRGWSLELGAGSSARPALVPSWTSPATLAVAATTLASVAILVIVAAHMLSN